MSDPLSEEVFDTMEDCGVVGIRVMVITGDNKETAEAICHEIGVFSPDEDIGFKCFTGKEFTALED
jgi:Ca2+-transporting ATPase